MASNILDTLRERGFISQITHEEELYDMLSSGAMTYYWGCDPTAKSLHMGNFVGIMMFTHLARAGLNPILLVGAGTARVSDPSGKLELRTPITPEQLNSNAGSIKDQLNRFVGFENTGAIMVNNADWLLKLNYIDFLEDVGVHFSVNRMLSAECYKQRYERGLTFFEFNYMLMQAYDFLELYRKHGCRLQVGGDDQWSNILAGADLIRRKERTPAFALTFPLLLNSNGEKMGKTVNGALFLDKDMTSPYDIYQYFRSIEDARVETCLRLLTFLPMDEVRRLAAFEGAMINEAKEILAYEITKIVHGEDEAKAALNAARALFSGGADDENIPSVTATKAFQDENPRVTDVLVLAGLCKSKSDARRQIEQGAVQLNGDKVAGADAELDWKAYAGGDFLLKKGKKSYCRIRVE